VDLTRRDVSELMTPRSAIVSLPATVSAAAAAQAFRETGHNRIPLFGENRDDILGILYARDLFPLMIDPDSPDAVIPRALARPAHCIPETKNAYELLEEFRSERTQIAIVLDEYGGVAGLITLKDLLEELVGAIDDEHDETSPDDPLKPIGDSRYEVDATLELEQLNELLHLRLPTDGDFLTVGGLAFQALGRVPEPGATFRIGGVEFTVLAVVDHSIRRVLLDLQPRATVGSQ
jgi:CBS domain containing-hemolysin-like protein